MAGKAVAAVGNLLSKVGIKAPWKVIQTIWGATLSDEQAFDRRKYLT